MTFNIHEGVGDESRPAADVDELSWRILSRALVMGGIDEWGDVDHEALLAKGLVMVCPRGERDARLLTALTVADGIRRIHSGASDGRREPSTGVASDTRAELSLALGGMDAAQMLVRCADQVVQCGLFGEVLYR